MVIDAPWYRALFPAMRTAKDSIPVPSWSPPPALKAE
jgi:hypothetical protein